SAPIRSSRNPPDSYCLRLSSETLIQFSSLRILSAPSMARKLARASRRSSSPHRRCFSSPSRSLASASGGSASMAPSRCHRSCPSSLISCAKFAELGELLSQGPGGRPKPPPLLKGLLYGVHSLPRNVLPSLAAILAPAQVPVGAVERFPGAVTAGLPTPSPFLLET